MAGYAGRGVHGQTVHLLGQRILSGEIAEGETIDLPALSRELDLSLTAMREALKVLAAKGLVDSRQKRGTFVRERAAWNLLDPDVVHWRVRSGTEGSLFRDLAELRAALEPTAAGLAARRRTDADAAALRAAVDGIAAAADGSPEDAAQADLVWHRTLLAATHNEMFTRMDAFLAAGLSERDRIVHGAVDDDPLPSHRAVTDAVIDEAPSQAEAAMRALLDKAEQDLRQVGRDSGDDESAEAETWA